MQDAIGFVGLGNIGGPMAGTLLRKMKAVTVFDLDAARVQALVDTGATRAASLAAFAEASGVILLSLPTSREVEAVLLGAGGISATAKPGTLIIDLTSGSPPRSKVIAAELDKKGIRYVDAGVSGGVAPAHAGTLGIMVGGADADVARAMPYLQAIGSTIVHLGPVGAGHLTKSLNNLLLASNMVAAGEALAVAVKAGLDPGKVIAAINGSSGRSWVTEYRFPKFVLKGDFSSQSGMAVALLTKDVAIACDTAKSSDVTLFVGNLIHQLLMRIGREVGSSAPNTTVVRAIEGWAGVEIRAANDG
jgi:3-hydroxyisobutyrate dehydrogenase-like beta-hydroxyacid dehydrogenase